MQMYYGYAFFTKQPFNIQPSDLELNIHKSAGNPSIDAIPEKKELMAFLNENPRITVLFLPDSGRSLYLYDPSGAFASEPLERGNYFNNSDFKSESSQVMVKENSIVSKLVKENNVLIDGEYKFLRAVYSTTSAFAINQNQYDSVSLLANAQEFNGQYILKNVPKKDAHYFLNIFNRYNYETELRLSRLSNKDWIRSYILQPVVLSMVLGIVFIYFSNLISYHFLLFKRKREFLIHTLYGASFSKLALRLFKHLSTFIIGGALLGTLLGSALITLSSTRPPWHLIGSSFLIHVVLSFVLLLLAFSKQKTRERAWSVML